MRTTLVILIICFCLPVFGQADFGWHERTLIRFGANYGISPVYRNAYAAGYAFFETENKLFIKNIPIGFKCRFSNEKLYYGRANYFKLSFDSERYRSSLKNQYSQQLLELEKLIFNQEQQLKKYESKLAYQEYKNNFKKPPAANIAGLGKQYGINTQQPAMPDYKVPDTSKPDYDSLNLNMPDVPDINTPKTNLPELNKPDLNYQVDTAAWKNKLQDSLQFDTKNKYLDSVQAIKAKLEEYKSSYQELKQKYEQLKKYQGTDLLSRFKTIDLGLTGLNTNGTGTSIPVQGLNVRYEDKHYFVELAAGFTLPNQILTTNVFNQIAYNQANVFNSGAGSFFQINSSKFISRVNVGYGKLQGNNITLETFYNSKIIKFSKYDTLYNLPSKATMTSNLTGRLALLEKKNLVLSASAGVTWLDHNVAVYKLQEHIGGKLQADYMFRRQQLSASYRYMSAHYDAWVQGMFLAQNERYELSHRIKLSDRFNVRYRYARNRYFSNSIFGGTVSNEYGADAGYFHKNIGVSGGYALLHLIDRSSAVVLNKDLSHMANFNFFLNKKLKKKGSYSFSLDNNSLVMATRDTLYKVIQSSVSNRLTFDRFYAGLVFKHQYFEGLNRIRGNYYIMQPEIGLQVKSFFLRGFVAFSSSQQYHFDMGGMGELGFHFNKHLSTSIQAQKYLKAEYFLFQEVPESVKPFLIKLTVCIEI